MEMPSCLANSLICSWRDLGIRKLNVLMTSPLSRQGAPLEQELSSRIFLLLRTGRGRAASPRTSLFGRGRVCSNRVVRWWTLCSQSFFVLNDDSWVFCFRSHRQSPLLEEFDVFLHPPFCLLHTILDGMANSCEPF